MAYIKAFEDAEFERRRSAVRHRMEDAGFDLLVCQDPANMNWLTGFDGWSFYTPQAVLVHRDDGHPIWFGRAQDARSATITTNLPAGNIVAFSEPLVHHSTRHPFDELCELIRQRGWGRARIGVDFDAHYYTARAHRHLVTGLPDATVSDNRELVNWARLVKSPAELAYMREAGALATRVMNQALDGLVPGRRQKDIIADVYHTQVSGEDGGYGDYTRACYTISDKLWSPSRQSMELTQPHSRTPVSEATGNVSLSHLAVQRHGAEQPRVAGVVRELAHHHPG